jgi:hypothetical protein
MMTGLVNDPLPLIVSAVVVRLMLPLTLYRFPAVPPPLIAVTIAAHDIASASVLPSAAPDPAELTYFSVIAIRVPSVYSAAAA